MTSLSLDFCVFSFFFFLSLFLNGFDIWHELWEYKGIKRDLILGDVKRKVTHPSGFQKKQKELSCIDRMLNSVETSLKTLVGRVDKRNQFGETQKVV